MRVTVKKQPSEGGLASVCQSPRGFIVSVDGKQVATVVCGRNDTSKPLWFWYGGGFFEPFSIPRKNSAGIGEFFATKEDAREACVAYVKACLAKVKETKW